MDRSLATIAICCQENLGCAVRNTTLPRRKYKNVLRGFREKNPCPFLPADTGSVMMFCTFMFGQTDAKTSQAARKQEAAKRAKSNTWRGEKGRSTADRRRKVQACRCASESDQEEAKGPWHGLTWRLIGPFRGGRVLAVSGVVGDAAHVLLRRHRRRRMEDHRRRAHVASLDR